MAWNGKMLDRNEKPQAKVEAIKERERGRERKIEKIQEEREKLI